MKKTAALLLSLLLLTQTFSAFALVKSMDIPFDGQGLSENALSYVDSAAAVGGTLYLANYDGFFALDGETGEVTKLAAGEGASIGGWGIPTLVTDGETLYGLDIFYGTLTRIVVTDSEVSAGEVIPFDSKKLYVLQDGESAYPVQVYSAVLLGNKLYLFTGSEDENNYDARALHEIDLETGACETLLTGTHLRAMTAYRDGNLVINVFDQDKHFEAYQSQDTLPTLWVFDTKEKALTRPLVNNKNLYATGLVYDEKTDAFYMMVEGTLFMQTMTGELTPVNYMMNSAYSDSQKAVLVNAAQYMLMGNSGIFIRSIDAADRPSNLLRVTGEDFSYTGKAGYQAFAKAHPEIAVTTAESNYYFQPALLYQSFLTSTAGDIYAIYDSSTLADLIRKDYCMDLSGSQVLMETIEKMYPHLTRALFKDGKLYAVPLSMHLGGVFGFSASLFEEIGIAGEDVPNTAEELMDFMVDWAYTYADANPDLKLFTRNYYPMRRLLTNYIFAQQSAYCQREGIPLTFDTPEVRLLLNKLDEVSPIISVLDPVEGEEEDFYWPGGPLVALIDPAYYLSAQYRADYESYDIMPIGLSEDIPMLYSASINMLMVNRDTKQPDAAVALLESLIANLEAENAYLLFPDRNEPVQSPYFLQSREDQEKHIKAFEEQLAKETDESLIAMLQTNIAAGVEFYDFLERQRYAISPDAINRYRGIASWVCPESGEFAVFYQTKNMNSLLSRLIENQMTGEQFIHETEKILRMMYLENQ